MQLERETIYFGVLHASTVSRTKVFEWYGRNRFIEANCTCVRRSLRFQTPEFSRRLLILKAARVVFNSTRDIERNETDTSISIDRKYLVLYITRFFKNDCTVNLHDNLKSQFLIISTTRIRVTSAICFDKWRNPSTSNFLPRRSNTFISHCCTSFAKLIKLHPVSSSR